MQSQIQVQNGHHGISPLHALPSLFCEDLIYQKDICVFQSVGQSGDTNTVIYTFWVSFVSDRKCDLAENTFLMQIHLHFI